MKHFFDYKTQSFYIDEINSDIPDGSIEITEQQHNELYGAINQGCIIFSDLSYSEPPPSVFHEWNGKKWVLDEVEQTTFKIKQNKSLKNSLLNEANENISILQDAVDLDMAEDGDEEKLKAWKKYRILLNRIDVSNIPVVFPEKP